jgi:hypothetical protein
MVHVIGEEVRDAQRIHALNEVTRLQDVQGNIVSELQLLTDEQQNDIKISDFLWLYKERF